MKNEQESKEESAEELQSVEHALQNNLMQRQTLQVEQNEIDTAMKEVLASNGEVYKLASGILIRSEPKKLQTELEAKKKMIEAKISALDKQSLSLENRASQLRKALQN